MMTTENAENQPWRPARPALLLRAGGMGRAQPAPWRVQVRVLQLQDEPVLTAQPCFLAHHHRAKDWLSQGSLSKVSRAWA